MIRNNFLNVLASLPKDLNSLPTLGGMMGGMTPPSDTEPATTVTSGHLRKWNKLINFAKQKGYAGNPQLDHDPVLRQRVFDEFNKENPKDAITQDLVKPIQNVIQEYKSKALSDIKANPTSYAGDPNNFMSGISQIDGIWGQKTSQWAFPENFIKNKETGEKKAVGLADKAALLKQLTMK